MTHIPPPRRASLTVAGYGPIRFLRNALLLICFSMVLSTFNAAAQYVLNNVGDGGSAPTGKTTFANGSATVLCFKVTEYPAQGQPCNPDCQQPPCSCSAEVLNPAGARVCGNYNVPSECATGNWFPSNCCVQVGPGESITIEAEMCAGKVLIVTANNCPCN